MDRIRINKFFIFFFIFKLDLFASEIVFKTGDAIICEIQSEDENVIVTEYKGKRYYFPRSEIQSIDNKKNGISGTYKYEIFNLKNGSKIIGVKVKSEPGSIVVKSDLGLLTIDNNFLEKESEDNKFNKFSLENYLKPKNLFGFGFFYGNAFQISSSRKIDLLGINAYVEPEFLFVNSSLRFGIQSNLQTNTEHKLNIFDLTFYGIRTFNIWNIRSLYSSFGIGGAAIYSKIENDKNYLSINPLVYLELGKKFTISEEESIRIGFFAKNILEQKGVVPILGIVISMEFSR